MTHARRRRIFGQTDFAMPSRFLEEAPPELLRYYGSVSDNDAGPSYTSNLGYKSQSKGYAREEFVDNSFGPSSFGANKSAKVRRPGANSFGGASSSVSSYYDEGRGSDARSSARRENSTLRISK